MVKTRIFRVGESNFYGDEILEAKNTHTTARLKAISDAGFTGIWLRGRLRELVPGELFEDYVKDVKERLKSLKTLRQRAAKHNLGVWLFFTEPLGLPCSHSFWKKNPNLIGHKTKIFDRPSEYSLCSSTAEVRDYLRNGFRKLFDYAPLDGAILITSSEQVNNCWGHVLSDPANYPCPEKFWADECKCPRCSERTPAEVLSEVINLIHQGVEESENPGKVVAWDWSWNMHYRPPYKEISGKINSNIALMGDFERGLTVHRLGKQRTMEEYSLVCPGPSQRFKAKVNAYSEKRKMFAKLQINTTHELATVANLPLIISLYRKLKYMYENNVSGTMACWNFGCFTDTLNVYAFNKFARKTKFKNEKLDLIELAKEYFDANSNHAENIVQSWYGFQKAAQNYPVNGYLFLYWSPINYALAYPLKEKFGKDLMGPSWLEHQWGSRLENTLGAYSLEEITILLRRLSDAWNRKVWEYKDALQGCGNTKRIEKELASAVITGCSFRSVYNIYRWYDLIKYKPRQDKPGDIIKDEIENLQNALYYIGNDKRFGYHQEAQAYMFSKPMIKQKLDDLKERIEQ